MSIKPPSSSCMLQDLRAPEAAGVSRLHVATPPRSRSALFWPASALVIAVIVDQRWHDS
jgi:hypothetical protein